MEIPSKASPNDATLDAAGPSPVAPPSPARPNVALVEGSTPQLSADTRGILRRRLRAASLLLSAGFLAFLVKWLFALDRFQTPLHWTLLGVHVAVTLLTGAIGVGLCRRCATSLVRLRTGELIIFGGPALFFILLQYSQLLECCRREYLVPMSPPWLVLLFTYGLFVPNTWPRAAAVVGSMAAAPVVLAVYLQTTSPEFSKLLNRPEFGGYLLELAMIMALSAVIATWGTDTIGSLRREAFEAKRLGQYRLKHEIGSGGMGTVYLAEHQLMKRPCALKVIHPEKAGDPHVLARFEREVRATAKLSHWNTVEIFDYGHSDDGTFYYVMEYLPGLSLAQLVELHGPLPPERVIYLLTQACEALTEAHSSELVHRDLKPGNIFAAKRGGVCDVAKLLDFGLAKPLADLRSPALTQEGSITGSPLFMSPEQATGDRPADARSDIYSLGAVAYYLLTGRAPFDGRTAIRVVIAHAHEPVTPPSEGRLGIPEDLELVVLRCLAKEPEDRYPDAESLRLALEDCGVAGQWNRQIAARWWADHGCPTKRALDEAALETVMAQ